MAGSDLNPSTNRSGLTGSVPREYNEHQRHSEFARMRHDNQRVAFLAQQATRLSTTSAIVFAKVTKYGEDRVRAAANLAALP